MIKTCKAGEAAALAAHFWDSLPPRQKAHTLWDFPFDARPQVLCECFKAADLVCISETSACWFFTYLGLTGAIHFATIGAPNERLFQEASIALKEARAFYLQLLAIIPTPFRGCRRFCEQLGFTRIADLPMACFLALHKRRVDGILYKKDI